VKKLIAMLLLAGFLCVNLVGCNSGSTTGKTNSTTGSATGTKGNDKGK